MGSCIAYNGPIYNNKDAVLRNTYSETTNITCTRNTTNVLLMCESCARILNISPNILAHNVLTLKGHCYLFNEHVMV